MMMLAISAHELRLSNAPSSTAILICLITLFILFILDFGCKGTADPSDMQRIQEEMTDFLATDSRWSDNNGKPSPNVSGDMGSVPGREYLICRSGKSATPTIVFKFFNLKKFVCAQKIANSHLSIRK